MKHTKRLISVILSFIMLLSITAGIDLSSYAAASVSKAISWAESQVGHRVGGGQCTDLVSAYWHYMGYNTYCNSGYKYPKGQGSMPPGSRMVVYKSGVTAQPGDVAVYSPGWRGNGWGHVAIVSAVSSGKMTVIEQYGSTDNMTHKNTINYNRGEGYVLYGFIRHAGSGGTNNSTPPSISVSNSNVALNLNTSKSAKINVTVNGTLPSKYTIYYSRQNANVSCSWGNWNGRTIPLTITGNYVGTTDINLEVKNSSTNQTLATKKISVTITANTYTISFNANGGYGAPSSVKTNSNGNGTLTLPRTVPYTNVSYTVNFDANGGTLPSGLKTTYKKVFQYWYDSSGNKYYPDGRTYTFKGNTTLYAHYSGERLSAPNPTRDNYYFAGWYDSNETNGNSGPVGALYKNSSTNINGNLTLYAMWNTFKAMPLGDTDGDGRLTNNDVVIIARVIANVEPSSERRNFVGDLNANGILDKEDEQLLGKYIVKSIAYEDLPAVKTFSGITVKSVSKTTYKYGEEFDYDGIVLQSNYMNSSVHHTISSDYVVTGYDPNKAGMQIVTINYYQYTTSLAVTVEAPSYTLTLEGNGAAFSNLSKPVKYDENYGTLPTPEKEGYTFDGWYTAPVGGTLITDTTKLSSTGNQTAYAHWTKNKYSVSYSANGGSNCPSGTSGIEYGTAYIVSSSLPKKQGYVFKGWSLINEDTGEYVYPDSILTVDNNITLYAIFDKPTMLEENAYTKGYILSENQAELFEFCAPESGKYCFYSFGAADLNPTIKLGSTVMDMSEKIVDSDGFKFIVRLQKGKTYTVSVASANAKTNFVVSVNNCKNIEHTHTYKQISAARATASKNGTITSRCTYCEMEKKTTIYYPKTISLSATSYTYNGKVKKPSVTVKDAKGKKVSSKYYTVSYSKGRKNVGQYTVTIKFKGNYSGTVKKTFTIKPKSTTISKVTAGKKAFTVKWKKQATQTTGYQIQYSTSSKFKSAKTVTVSKNKTTSKKISKLKARKKYYVRIRTYKTVKVNGKNTKVYSSWSKVKTVKTK